jgi:hypothetical protein
MLRIIMLVAAVIAITSCASKSQTTAATPATGYKQCPDQRSQICTREYLPVCATRDTGVRCVTTPCPSSEQKTYSNGCTACADEKVLGYIANACANESETKH